MATNKNGNGDDYSIFSPEFSTNSLSATGFKSTHYAIAELIDNSVQSALEDKENQKCNIEVIAIDKDQKLSKIIVVDDAGGMDKNVLRYSLGVGKGKHIRTIFISPRAAGWLRKYLDSRRDVSKPLFINIRSKTDDNRLSARSIQKMISRSAILAGISKKVTPHTLRHTYATDLLGHGADLRSVQELLGHKNVATTQIYTHVTNKRLRDIHEKFHGGKEMDI